MAALTEHEHPVDAAAVAAARTSVIGPAEAGRLTGLLNLLADPVRSRILFALSAVPRLCVGDIALSLRVSEDAVSYGLKLLRLSGLVAAEKEGRAVFYSLAPGFPHTLLEHCLRELLAISTPQGKR